MHTYIVFFNLSRVFLLLFLEKKPKVSTGKADSKTGSKAGSKANSRAASEDEGDEDGPFRLSNFFDADDPHNTGF